LALHFLQDLREPVGALFSLHFLIHNNDRGLAAGAHTATLLQRYLSIGRRLTQLDIEHLLGLFDELWNAGDIASRAQTKLDGVFAARLRLEKGIKRDNAVDLSERNIQTFRDIRLHEGGDVTDVSLDFVQYEHHSAGSFFVFGDRLVNHGFLFHTLQRVILRNVS
jgi:hypothetical protein